MKNNSTRTYVIDAVEETISFIRHKYSVDKISFCIGCVDDILDSIKKNRTVLSCLSTLKTYDRYTFSHSINVFFLSIMIGSALGLNKNQLHDLGMSALLHDIGKTLIPKKILNKKTKLTDLDFSVIKTHTAKGYFYVKEKISLPDVSFLGILHHHEKFDGTGYPVGIKQKNIDIFGRIISIADVYDAMTSDRPYRKAQTHTEAIQFIQHNSDKHFDSEIAAVFITDINRAINL